MPHIKDGLMKSLKLNTAPHRLNNLLDNSIITDVSIAKEDLQRILVVEDEQMNRELFVEMINCLGFQADSACDGIEALEKIQEKNYGLVISDWQMPHMDGFELAQKMHKMQQQSRVIPLVMMTGTIPAESEKHIFIEYGVSEFVAKPISLNTLSNVLLKYLSKDSASKGTTEDRG